MRQKAAGNEDGAPVPASTYSPRREKKARRKALRSLYPKENVLVSTAVGEFPPSALSDCL